jgi:hypothetical protein
MHDCCTYTIEIRGQTEESDLNSSSPVRLTIERVAEDRTVLSARTDQSGLIGAIRRLHDLGLVILSVVCAEENGDIAEKTAQLSQLLNKQE